MSIDNIITVAKNEFIISDDIAESISNIVLNKYEISEATYQEIAELIDGELYLALNERLA